MLRTLVLKLLCLSKSDREWILSNLAEDERQKVTSLMEEAKDLGVIKNKSVSNSLLNELENNKKGEEIHFDHADNEALQSLDKFWQKILLGATELSTAKKLIRSLKLEVSEDELLLDTPPQLRKSLINLVRGAE